MSVRTKLDSRLGYIFFHVFICQLKSGTFEVLKWLFRGAKVALYGRQVRSYVC